MRRQFPSELTLNSVGAVALNLAQRIQNGVNLPQLSGLGSNFFYAFPQFGQVRVIDSNDFSTYHGLEVQVLRRLTKGLEAQFSWTWSKSLDTRSYDPSLTLYGTNTAQSATSHPFDVANRALNYARSDFDRRHILNSYWIWELPYGRGRRFGGSAHPVVRRRVRRLASRGVPPVPDGSSVYGVFRSEHIVERVPEHGAVQRMLAG